MLLVPVYLITLFPLIVVSFSPSVFLFRSMFHPLPLPLSSCLGCIPPHIGLPSLRFYAVASSLFLLSVCLCLCFLFYRDDVLCWLLSLSVLFCRLSMLISDSWFDLVWFRLSCDHGWIRSGSVNVRKTTTTHGIPPDVRGGVHIFLPPHTIGSVQSLSGHAVAYQWRSLPRVGCHRASIVFKVVRVTGYRLCITMDQLLLCASLFPHPLLV